MVNILVLLWLCSVIAFIVGLIKPAAFGAIFKEKATRKSLCLYFGGTAFFLLIVIGSVGKPIDSQVLTPTSVKTTISQTKIPSTPLPNHVIHYDVLQNRPSNTAPEDLYLEILISEKDATKDNIINLIKSIVPASTKKAVIGIYQSKQVWLDAQNNKYGEAFDKGYLAHYTKNMYTNATFEGYNAITWFQEKGPLQSLSGTETKIIN